MKKIHFVALMAMALTAVSFTSCSKDDDNNSDKKQEEEQVEQSQWSTNIVGTWSYDSGVNTGTRYSGDGTSQKKGTLTSQQVLGLTVGGGSGTYSCKYDGKTKWEDGTTTDDSYSYNVSFTYEYVNSAYDFSDKAYLKGKVTKTDNPDMVKEGSDFYICINSMTKNTANIHTSKESWVDSHTFTRK